MAASGNVAWIGPHADDDLLSAGYGLTFYAKAGYNIHGLLMSRGPVTAAALRLDGATACSFHPYTHEPALEGYSLPSLDDIGGARWAEFKTAIYAMGRISPAVTGTTGDTFFYEGGLGTNYGCNGCGSSTAPVTEQAITAARAVIEPFIDSLPPNTHIRTMSPTDKHPDHAAAGIACYRMWQEAAWHTKMGDLMFFASRLYWGNAALGIPRDPALAAEPCSWFPADTGSVWYAEIVNHLRTVVRPAYAQWCPPGAWAVGEHSVHSQMEANFGTGVSVSNLWHPPVAGRNYPVVP